MIEASTTNYKLVSTSKYPPKGIGTHQIIGVKHLCILINDGVGRARADLGGSHPVVRAHGALTI